MLQRTLSWRNDGFDALALAELSPPMVANDFHVFDIHGSVWTELPPSLTTPSARTDCGLVSMGKMLYLFGGAVPPPNGLLLFPCIQMIFQPESMLYFVCFSCILCFLKTSHDKANYPHSSFFIWRFILL